MKTFARCWPGCLLAICLAAPLAVGQEIGGPHPASTEQRSPRLEFLQLETGARFRYMDNRPGTVTDRDPYVKFGTRLRLNFHGGRAYLQVRAETGSTFSGSWNYAESGEGKRATAFNLKGLYLGQKFGRRGELQIGGIDFERGAGTEATSADQDGWLTGYRASVYTKTAWLPDRIGFTAGYVGDFKSPNFFSRARRMGETNYYQVIGLKGIGKDNEVSAEFDSIQSITYARVAAHSKVLHTPVADDFTIEMIGRMNDARRFGWSATALKALDPSKQWRASATYSDIPRQMFLKGKREVLLNGDSMTLGKRLGINLRFLPSKNLELATFISRKLDSTPNVPRWRAQASIRYQFGDLANRFLSGKRRKV